MRTRIKPIGLQSCYICCSYLRPIAITNACHHNYLAAKCRACVPIQHIWIGGGHVIQTIHVQRSVQWSGPTVESSDPVHNLVQQLHTTLSNFFLYWLLYLNCKKFICFQERKTLWNWDLKPGTFQVLYSWTDLQQIQQRNRSNSAYNSHAKGISWLQLSFPLWPLDTLPWLWMELSCKWCCRPGVDWQYRHIACGHTHTTHIMQSQAQLLSPILEGASNTEIHAHKPRVFLWLYVKVLCKHEQLDVKHRRERQIHRIQLRIKPKNHSEGVEASLLITVMLENSADSSCLFSPLDTLPEMLPWVQSFFEMRQV